jgi:hypothetical protein
MLHARHMGFIKCLVWTSLTEMFCVAQKRRLGPPEVAPAIELLSALDLAVFTTFQYN